jgi:hypothetical protein
MAYITMGPKRGARRRGLGDDTSGTTDFLSSITGAVDPSTGLPIILEIGFGLLGALFLMSYAGGVQKRYKRRGQKKRRVTARKAALQAELAAL